MEKRKIRVLSFNGFFITFFEGKLLGKVTKGRPRRKYLNLVRLFLGAGRYDARGQVFLVATTRPSLSMNKKITRPFTPFRLILYCRIICPTLP